MRNDGAEEVSCVSCFRCPMIAVSFLSYSHRSAPSHRLFSVGLIACLSYADHDELRGLCVVLCSRLIASVSSGILFPVPCDGFLSAFLFLARCCCMSGFIFVALSLSSPPRLPFFGGIRDEGDFFIEISPACLPRHLSRSSHVLPFCGLLRALRLFCSDCPISSRPSPRLLDTDGGEIMATRCLLAGGTVS